MRVRTAFIVFNAVLLTGGCEVASTTKPRSLPATVPSNWQTIHAADAFTFKVPADVTELPTRGIDSLVREYESPTLSIDFDYGMYSNPLENTGKRTESVVIDGWAARMVYDGGSVHVHFPRTPGGTLTLSVITKNGDVKTAEAVIQSIDFP